MNKRNKGKFAETYVEQYLINKGYKILETNYTIRGGEIDIITKIYEKIVFVEVKSLNQKSNIDLMQTISKSKRLHLINSCEDWLHKNDLTSADWRIDFVGIKLINYDRITSLIHIKGAIY